MYGLTQAGILANKLIKTCLAAHGYHELSHTPGLFKHDFWPVWFTLIVDDFGIKYEGTESCKHFLFDIFEQFYKVEVGMKGSLYFNISLELNYKDKYMDISMPI